MRASLPIAFLLSTLLTACAAFKSEIPPSKHISQSGPLKVHPGLLGQPVPAEQKPATSLPPEEAGRQPSEKDRP